MLSILELYEDVTKDSANQDENGSLTIARFNRLSRRAELKMLDWLSGDVAGIVPPEPYLTQKNKDFLAPFIKKFLTQVVNGAITRPDDYYRWENFYMLGAGDNADCDEDIQPATCNTTITILEGSAFNNRCTTYIAELKPSMGKPIAKAVGRTFEVSPVDLGSVGLEYIRLPVFGRIVPVTDPTYNIEVPGPASRDYEWGEEARELFVWFITDLYSNNTREQAIKQFNQASGKTQHERQ